MKNPKKKKQRLKKVRKVVTRMVDNESKPQQVQFRDSYLKDVQSSPSSSYPVLVMQNYTTYWFVNTLVTFSQLVGYIITSLVIEHQVCRFAESDYVDDPFLPVHDDHNLYPNITPTVQLTFISGLILHTFLFILNTYFELRLRFYKPQVKSDNVGDWLNSDVDPKREMMRVERLIRQLKIIGASLDLVLRVLLVGQAGFSLAFNYTLAMRHCAVHRPTLRLESAWAVNLAVSDLLTLPVLFIWRQFYVDEYPSPGFKKYRQIVKEQQRQLRLQARMNRELQREK